MSRSQTTLAEGRRALSRVAHAWRVLGREQRWAALTALGLFVSMLLPWYSKTVVVRDRGGGTGTQSLSAFQAFSFVEAAVLLVSAGVLAMLFARAEGRRFQLPGGDGTIITIAGAWAAILIFYRMLDKPGLQGNERIVSSVGVEWGIFIALLVALTMVYAGRRIRADERGQPPLSRRRESERRREYDGDEAETVMRSAEHEGDDFASSPPAGGREQTVATAPVAARLRPPRRREVPPPDTSEPPPPRGRPRFPPPPSGPSQQMSFEDSPAEEE